MRNSLPLHLLFSALALLLAAIPLRAQVTGGNPEETMRFLAATTFQDAATGRNMAYVVWQARDPDALKNRAHVLFGKPGQPSSAAAFTRRASLSFQTNTTVLAALVDSTPAQLLDPPALSLLLDDLLGNMTGSGLTLPEKLSGALQVAQTDAAVFRRLLFMSRTQPLVGIAMGTASVVPVSTNVTTLEARIAGADESVVAGRVTVDLTNPPNLPKPGPPVHVTDLAASGNLNVKLRWGVPDDLRRNSPLTYGFDTFRMTRAYAESAGYHLTPPTPAVMAGLVISQPLAVKLINQLPIIPAKLMNLPEAADLLADPETAFITDDNGVLLDGGIPLSDGDQFYYFASARDLLGRPGRISNGTLVTFCDRMRPRSSSRLDVSHAHDASATPQDFLRVSWAPPTAGETPDSYYVYRWENTEQMVKADAPAEFALRQIGGPIVSVPGKTRYTFDDDGAGAPSNTTDLGKTFWYSVRAVKTTACGPLYGANSPPGYGVLRDRSGPNSADSELTLSRYRPFFITDSMQLKTLTLQHALEFTGPLGNTHYVHLKVRRIDPRIQGVQAYIYAQIPTQGVPGGVESSWYEIGREAYTPGDDLFEVKGRLSAEICQQGSGYSLLLVGRDVAGNLAYDSRPLSSLLFEGITQYVELDVLLDEHEAVTVISGGSVASGDSTHTAVEPGTATINPISIQFSPSATTREYKLYKRVDGSPLLLVEQAEYDGVAPEITIEDYELPANSARVCYFIQYFDEHGNPSPLADLGCLTTTAKAAMPVPILSQVERQGTQTSPQGLLRWFCQRDGVERFQVSIKDGDTNVPVDFSPDLSRHFAPVIFFIPKSPVPSGATDPEKIGFLPYDTGRVGGNFDLDATPNDFSVLLNLVSGREYEMYVQSVSAAGDLSAASNTVSFVWTPALAAAAQIPWPARGLPAVDPDFISKLEADYAKNSNEDRWYSTVQIGEVSSSTGQFGVQQGSSGTEGDQIYRNPGSIPDDGTHSLDLYLSGGGETALPFVLYRYQVANDRFPNVSRDVVQVSPLIDRMRTANFNSGGPRIGLYDPYIEILTDPDGGAPGIFVKDTQGAIRGARYVYVLVRFKPNGEIDRSIPTNELTIPLVDPP